ncbi:MAG: hypothetical protein AAGG48_18625 [Planctomycetota bacterium]
MDSDKIKSFFANHVEKMILVVVIGASVFLVYSGLQKENFLDEHQPEKLRADASQVRTDIDLDHNESVLKEDIESTQSFDIVAETEKLYTAVEPSLYKLDRTWEGKTLENIVRRQDPVMIAPSSIQLTPVTTAIAKRARTDSDEAKYALAQLDDADALEKEERRPRRRRTRRSSDMMEGMMGEMDGMDGMMGMMGGMGAGGGARGGGGGMESDLGMGLGAGEETASANRKFDPDYDLSGFRPTKTDDERLPEPALGRFIVGTALVPHQKLYENFELALKDAAEYSPQRDTPYYYGFKVQRADVTDKPVDQLAEEDWVQIGDRLRYTNVAAKYWSGFAPETVEEDYREDAFTMWLPPVLLDDYRPWAKHSMIPEMSPDELERLANEDDEVTDFGTFNEDELDDISINDPGQGGGRGSGAGDYGGMLGMDMGMDAEMDDGGMSGMMMGMMMGMSGRGVEENPVDHKMIRFYDFGGFRSGPKPGRKYVYRVAYSVVDPNFPFSQRIQPQFKYLAPEVATRVGGLMKEAKDNESRDDLFERWSDWSEPSEPMSLPSLEQYFVGPVDRGSVDTVTVGGKKVEFARKEPKAKLVASQYHPTNGARVPVELDVIEGTVLTKEMESADVVDPISLKIKKLPNANLYSGTTVVDIDGAKPLGITEDVKSPGLMLLFDQTGKLTVREETDDLELYRIYSYAEERGVE